MDLKNYKNLLENEKKLLEEELGGLGKVDEDGDWEAMPDNELSSQEVQDEADIADKANDYEERSSKLNLLEKRLADINTSLSNIDSNSFGNCGICLKQIEIDRLDANPAAQTCKECMEKVT
jgi:DnaK suppressor protein